jgi:hypothetical protein
MNLPERSFLRSALADLQAGGEIQSKKSMRRLRGRWHELGSDLRRALRPRQLRAWAGHDEPEAEALGDVPASERPALFQAQKTVTFIQQTGLPSKRLLSVDLYLYVHTAGAASPGEVLNPIIDDITAKLDNQPFGTPQTLGGLVEYARIEGAIETDEGTLGDDAVAIIPVSILSA